MFHIISCQRHGNMLTALTTASWQIHTHTHVLYKKLAGCCCEGCEHMPLQPTADSMEIDV